MHSSTAKWHTVGRVRPTRTMPLARIGASMRTWVGLRPVNHLAAAEAIQYLFAGKRSSEP